MTQTETLDALIADAERALAKAEREVEHHRMRVREAMDVVKSLQEEIKGLKLARSRKGGPAPEPEERADTGLFSTDEWPSMTRTAAIERALRVLGKPVAPADIAAYLHQQGRDDSSRYVGAALNYLRKRGTARRIGHGMWVAALQQDAQPERTRLA